MGCASSTPMVQTAGSDVLKAATHVADDATKTAEDAVQGAKDTMGKSLETAKEAVTTTVEEVKHEVESTLKEKAGQLDEAKNSLMGKLHSGSNAAAEAATSTVAAVQQDVLEGKAEAEMAIKNASGTIKQNVESLQNQSNNMANDIESVLGQTDTDTDSLKTSTPEPEIERAMAKKNGGNGGDNEEGDEDHDGPPTPVPTFSELENLNNELLSQQTHMAGNDLTLATNDPVMTKTSATAAETTDKMPTTATATATSSTTTSSNTSVTTTLETTKSSEMHIPPIPIASATSVATAIASSMASAMQFNQPPDVAIAKESISGAEALALAAKKKAQKRDEKVAADRAKQRKMIQELQEEKRPSTTEWEKYADMLALFRKYNPHDAFRRGGTLTKMSNQFAPLPIREKTLLGRPVDDDSSDSASNRERISPGLRSSAKLGGRVQRPSNARPTSANQRGAANGSSVRRNSAAGNNGRKFDYNPTRSRLNNNATSNVSSGKNFNYNSVAYRITPPNGTQSQSQSHSPPPTQYKHESVKSPIEMRSQHSHLGTNSCQRLERLHRQGQEQQQQQQQQQHVEQLMYYGKSIATLPHLPTSPSLSPPAGGSSMPPDAMHLFNCHHLQPSLTRESSITSLSSLSTERGLIRSFKSTNDLTSAHAQTLNRPVRNTSSFLSTPRTSPFYLTKSYTDLYFSSSGNNDYESNSPMNLRWSAQQKQIRDKSPYKVRERCEVCRRKYIKT